MIAHWHYDPMFHVIMTAHWHHDTFSVTEIYSKLVTHIQIYKTAHHPKSNLQQKMKMKEEQYTSTVPLHN